MKKNTHLLDQALEHLQQTLKVQGEVRPAPARYGREADAVIRLFNKQQEWFFDTDIKAAVNNATTLQIEKQIREHPHKALLVTPYINPKLADRLKERNIPFIDAVGNIFLNEPGLYIFVKGNRPEKITHHVPQGRPFKQTGLKVVFALLCKPGLRNATYREIADAADVALGTVAGVMTDLNRMGYLIKIKKNQRKMRNGEILLNKWTDAYLTQLRPRLITGRYAGLPTAGHWLNAPELANLPGLIGGEVAAARLTRYLKPETLTIYTGEQPGPLLLKLGLKKDPGGNVEILKKFWNFELHGPDADLVPPLLVYADLVGIDDPRTTETAGMILEKELIHLGNL